METLYRKVAVSKRNPTKEGIYNTSRGFLSYSKVFGWVTIQNYTTPNPKWWLEEITDPTAQLKADKVELLEALERVKSLEQLICLGGAVEEQWVSEALALDNMMTEIESLIQKHKQ